MPKPKPWWSEAEEETLDRLDSQGLSAAEIAAALPGRTPASVRQKLRRAGSLRDARAWTSDQDELLRQFASNGQAPRTMARRLGRSKCAIEHRMAKLGIRRGQGWRPRSYCAAQILRTLERAVTPLERVDIALKARIRGRPGAQRALRGLVREGLVAQVVMRGRKFYTLAGDRDVAST